MKYLDRKASDIASKVRAELIRILPNPDNLSLSEVDESPYASERGDRGASFVVYQGEEAIADVRVEIPSAEGYGEEGGWGFGLACTLVGGGIGPGGTICNYSDEVWTADRGEIRARLESLRSSAERYAHEVAAYLDERLNP